MAQQKRSEVLPAAPAPQSDRRHGFRLAFSIHPSEGMSLTVEGGDGIMPKPAATEDDEQ